MRVEGLEDCTMHYLDNKAICYCAMSQFPMGVTGTLQQLLHYACINCWGTEGAWQNTPYSSFDQLVITVRTMETHSPLAFFLLFFWFIDIHPAQFLSTFPTFSL